MIEENRILLLTKPYLTIYLYPDKFLHADWHGFMDMEQIEAGASDILKAISDSKAKNLIVDARKANGNCVQCDSWLSENLIPRLIQSGIVRIGYIFPIHKPSRYFIDSILRSTKNLEGKSFEKFEDATEWLTGSIIREMEIEPFILLKTLDDYSKIDIKDIYYVSTSEKYNIVHTLDGEHHTKKSLNDLLDVLPSVVFFRIHKSFIVNINKIKSLKYHAGGYYHLFLHDMEDITLTVGRKYAKTFREELEGNRL